MKEVVPVEEPEAEEYNEEKKKRHLNVVFIGHVGKFLMAMQYHIPKNK